METTLIDWLHQLGTLEFWEALLEGFEGLGPLVPILLAMLESIFPPLPLIAIVALNVAAHGGLLGFVYSWVGVAAGGTVVFLFWRRVVKRFFWKLASRSEKLKKAPKCRTITSRMTTTRRHPRLRGAATHICLLQTG